MYKMDRVFSVIVIVIFVEVQKKNVSGKRRKILSDSQLTKVSETIVKETNDPGSRLYNSLLEKYRLSKAEAVLHPFQFSFWPLDGQATQSIIEACNQGQLAELIHESIDIEGVSKAWGVDLRLDISSLNSFLGGNSGQGKMSDSGFVSGPLDNSNGYGWVRPIERSSDSGFHSGLDQLSSKGISGACQTMETHPEDSLHEDADSGEDMVDACPPRSLRSSNTSLDAFGRNSPVGPQSVRSPSPGKGNAEAGIHALKQSLGSLPADTRPQLVQSHGGNFRSLGGPMSQSCDHSSLSRHIGNDAAPMVSPFASLVNTAIVLSSYVFLAIKDFSAALTTAIKKKQTSDYDFICLLKSNLDRHDITTIQDNDGNYLLHQCVISNRISFLKVIYSMGLLPIVIDQVIPSNAASDFKGCTPLEVATRLRLRRLARELEKLKAEELVFSTDKTALKDCRSGLLEKVKMHSLRDLEETDVDGSTAVHWACTNGTLELVKFVVEKGIKANVVNLNSQTPLHVAVSWGQSPLIGYLATDCKLNPTVKDKGGKTPLQVTAENGDTKSLDELLRCGVPLERDLNVRAAHFGRDKYLQYVLDIHGLDPYQKESNSGRNCLMAAVEFGHVIIVKYLLKRFSFKIDEVSTQKRSVFHFAADNGHTEVAEVLLEYAKGKGYDIVKLLSQRDQHKIDRLCSMVRGIDKGKAAWHYVHLKRRCVHIFQKNTKRGRVDASKMGTIVQSGWGEGADADQLKESLQRYMSQSQTRNGQPDLSPLALAISRGQTEVAKLYIAAGASVETRDCFGQTLMHLAAMRGMLDVAEMLKDQRLSAKEKDDDGITPIQVAELNEHQEMITFLQAPTEECETLVQDFLKGKVKTAQENLSRQKLQEIRRSGQDLVKHVVDAVRDLQIDINILLQELGSGPVLEESREGSARPPVH